MSLGGCPWGGCTSVVWEDIPQIIKRDGTRFMICLPSKGEFGVFGLMCDAIRQQEFHQIFRPWYNNQTTLIMAIQHKITPNLWFNDNAEEAASFYVSVFRNSRINTVRRYPDAGQETHGRDAGSVMTVEFTLDGQDFVGLNGGPLFTFNEAVSFIVTCKDQEELDYLWDKLSEGGDPSAQQCGWLKDKFGLCWQVVPEGIDDYLSDDNPQRAKRAMEAFMKMKKIDMNALKLAAEMA